MDEPMQQQSSPPLETVPPKRHAFRVVLLMCGVVLFVAGITFFLWKGTAKPSPSVGRPVIDTGMTPSPAVNTPSVDPFPNDADRDGMTNAEEKKRGLNPKEFDTDGDGISDYDEIHAWHTDPKKKDTDGDGFSDGIEIIGGYNPLGKGR